MLDHGRRRMEGWGKRLVGREVSLEPCRKRRHLEHQMGGEGPDEMEGNPRFKVQ